MKKNLANCLFILMSVSASPAFANAPTMISNNSIPARNIEWKDLMPAEDLKLLESMTPVDHSTLSQKELANDKPLKKNSLRSPDQSSSNQKNTSKFEASASSATKESAKTAADSSKKRTWKDALISTNVRPEFNNVKIKIDGFIVPLEYDNNQLIKTFFLVPYFGACIHVPPPPPNQIIYVRSQKPLKLHDIYTPYSITGVLHTETVEKEIGISSYSLDSDKIVVYKEE